MIDPKKLADLIANSSLKTEDKVALVELLSSLDMKTIQTLMTILEEDVHAQEAAITNTEKAIADFFGKVEIEFPNQ